jgi:microcin C transport system substrate-binding protein
MNTEYASSGLPSARELEILTPFKDQLPAELFTQEFLLNKTDGSGNIRKEIRTALQLFKQAGYQLTDQKLLDSEGKQLEFEIILYSDSMERIVIPFQKNLEKVGVKMNIRMLSDTSQFINRLRERDFDMVVSTLTRGGQPSELMLYEWHSKYIDSTYNVVGPQDPMIDFLVDKIIANQENNDELIPYAQAFDRVLLWQYYSIPQWHNSSYRVAYWNKFARPETLPKYDLGQSSWWFDGEKAKKLPPKNQ